MTEPAIEDGAIDAWARALGLGRAVADLPGELRDAARAAVALSDTLRRLDAAAAPPPGRAA